MPKGDNKCVINLTTELKVFMDKRKGDLERSFHACLTYLKQYEKEFISEYGQESYDEHVKRYSRTAIQLRNEAKERREKQKEELERRLAIMERNSEAYANQTDLTKEKQLDKRQVERLETPEYRELTKKKREAENFLGEIERGEHKIVTEEQKTKLKADIAELDQKIKAFLEA